MNETISCPSCGHEIPLSDALTAELRAELESRLDADHEARLQRAVAATERRVRGALALDLADLRMRLAEQAQRADEAIAREAALNKEKEDLEEAQEAQGERIRDSLRKERERQIADLRQALADAGGSDGPSQIQRERLGLDIVAALGRQFSGDRIKRVLDARRTADIQQRVRNGRLEDCGLILWQTKSDPDWEPAWVEALAADQRATSAAAAVLICVALPDGVESLCRIDGVWVVNIQTWPVLAMALREQLIQVAGARAVLCATDEQVDLLYRYLAGDEFRLRVEAIVETFELMQSQIRREREVMEKHWAEREKQTQRVIGSTASMHGALRAIACGGLAAIPALELDADGRLKGDGEA